MAYLLLVDRWIEMMMYSFLHSFGFEDTHPRFSKGGLALDVDNCVTLKRRRHHKQREDGRVASSSSYTLTKHTNTRRRKPLTLDETIKAHHGAVLLCTRAPCRSDRKTQASRFGNAADMPIASQQQIAVRTAHTVVMPRHNT